MTPFTLLRYSFFLLYTLEYSLFYENPRYRLYKPIFEATSVCVMASYRAVVEWPEGRKCKAVVEQLRRADMQTVLNRLYDAHPEIVAAEVRAVTNAVPIKTDEERKAGLPSASRPGGRKLALSGSGGAGGDGGDGGDSGGADGAGGGAGGGEGSKKRKKKKELKGSRKKRGAQKQFDMSGFEQDLVVLKFLYYGEDLHGFASQENTDNTVEFHLFTALKRTCLVPDTEGPPLEYSRCGRTDKGVSAFSQVVALKLRGRRKRPVHGQGKWKERSDDKDTFNPDYCNHLNRALPPFIRAYAWAYVTGRRAEQERTSGGAEGGVQARCVCVRVSKTSRVHEGRIAGLCVAM